MFHPVKYYQILGSFSHNQCQKIGIVVYKPGAFVLKTPQLTTYHCQVLFNLSMTLLE